MTLRYTAMVLIFLAAFVSDLHGQSKQPPSKTSQQNSAQQERGTDNSPVVVKILPTEKSKTELATEKEKQESDKQLVELTGDLAKYTKLLFIATALLVIATAGLVVFGFIQSSDSKRSIAAAETSAAVAERALTDLERPWLFLASVSIRFNPSATGLLEPNRWFLKLHWKNVGRAPAIVDECLFSIELKKNLPETPVYNPDLKLNCQHTIAEKETVETNEVGPARRQDEEILVFFGRMTYRELGGKKHETGYAIEVSPHMPAYSPHDSSKYNYYT